MCCRMDELKKIVRPVEFFKNVSAPTNLEIPPHRYSTQNEIEIGTDYIEI
jgi:hypothetical protein